MRLGKEALCLSSGLTLCLLLGGCIGLTRSPLAAPLDARGVSAQPQGEAPPKREVPLVPLPVPPQARPTAAPPSVVAPPMPPVVPVPPEPMPSPAVNGLDNIRRLQTRAAERIATMDSYIVRLSRREVVRGEQKPEEVILFTFRNAPWSVYFKWLGPNGRGREVLYVKGQHDNKIHTKLAAGDMPLAPAGKRMALSPDNILVRNASRHPITEAGLAASTERIGRILTAVERNEPKAGTLVDLGAIDRPEFSRPVAAIEHHIPPGIEAELQRGGRRLYCFDPETGLPTLLVTRDHTGREVEYYFHDRLQFPVRLDDNDFHPDRLWGKPVAQTP
jgi:hypothetical protein